MSVTGAHLVVQRQSPDCLLMKTKTTRPPTPDSHSLPESYQTVAVPHAKAGFWRQWMAFSGPAILISVGYMDPGNWGTDLAAGAQFK